MSIYAETDQKISVFQEDPEATVYSEGSLVQVTLKRKYKQKTDFAPRGRISKFSRKSRKRLMDKLNKVKRDHLPQFLTLTYPGEYTLDPRDWKKHLKLFSMRMEYRFPKFCAVWKLEPQKRGAPHFHLLAWGLPVHWKVKEILSATWYETVGSGDIRHLRAGTQIQPIRSRKGVMWYASKYLCKQEGDPEESSGWDFPGRYWGILFRQNVPWSSFRVIRLNRYQVYDAIRYIEKFLSLEPKMRGGLILYTDDPDAWGRLIAEHTKRIPGLD